ncbi:MAG TPA: DMT family transporter [Gemmatimonadaceae bacterium]|nr:DMT family transporter [Gemmatimonadaceae bacterium]
MTSTVRDATRVAPPAASRGTTGPAASLTDGLLLLTTLIWGANYAVVKYGASVVRPLAYNSARVAVAAVVLVALAAGSRRVKRFARRDLLALLALGVLGNGLYQFLFVEGIARTRAGDAALVVASTPALVALLGRVLGVERVGARAAGGIILSIAGVGCVVFGASVAPGGQSTVVGNLIILVGAACWALYTVLLKPYANRLDALGVNAITMTGGAIPLLLIAVPALAATPWRHLGAGAVGAIAYGSIGSLVIAYLFWYRGIRVLGPTRTATYSNLQPLVAILVAWLFLREVPTPWQWGGAVAIIAGVIMTRT